MFLVEISAKNEKFGYLNPILGKLGVTHGRPLCTQILPGRGRPPSTIPGIRKLDTGLHEAEDHIPLRSLVLTQYRSVTDRHMP